MLTRLAAMFPLLRKRFEIVAAAYSSWAALLGTILATVALCNFVFRILNVSVFEALAVVLAAYEKTFHPPIDYLFSLVSLRLPAIAKDGLVFYGAIGGVLYRTLSYKESSALHAEMQRKTPAGERWRMGLRMWIGQVRAAIAWPLYLQSILRYPSLLIRSSLGYHGRLPPPRRDLSPDRRKEVVEEMLSFSGPEGKVIIDGKSVV